MNMPLRLFRIAARLIRGLCALVIIAWLTGRVVSDTWAWSQWLLWIPTPAVLLTTMGAAVTTFLATPAESERARFRRRRITWWSALGVMAVYFCTIEHRMLHRTGSPRTGLSVLHWNMMPGPGDDRDTLGKVLMTIEADLTIVTNIGRSLGSDAVKQHRAAGGRILRVGAFTILTDLPVIEMRPLVSASQIELATITVDASDTLDKPLVVWMIDLPSDPGKARCDIVRLVLALIATTNAPIPDLIVGDFNLTRGARSLRRLAPGYRNAYDDAGHGYGGSYPRTLPLFHIDHMLLNEDIAAERYDLLDLGASRHRAQRMSLKRSP